MSLADAVEKRNVRRYYELKLEAYCTAPWAALAAYQALREQAKLHGLEDLGHTYITVTVEVSGSTYYENVVALREHMERMSLGELVIEFVKELHNG